MFTPKPVPVTVRRVPPELPVDGDKETRVGVIVALLNASKPVGRPSAKYTRTFFEVESKASVTLKVASVVDTVRVSCFFPSRKRETLARLS